MQPPHAMDIDDGAAEADSVSYSVHPPVILPSPPLLKQPLPILSPSPPSQPPDPFEVFAKLNPELVQWYRSTFKRSLSCEYPMHVSCYEMP